MLVVSVLKFPSIKLSFWSQLMHNKVGAIILWFCWSGLFKQESFCNYFQYIGLQIDKKRFSERNLFFPKKEPIEEFWHRKLLSQEWESLVEVTRNSSKLRTCVSKRRNSTLHEFSEDKELDFQEAFVETSYKKFLSATRMYDFGLWAFLMPLPTIALSDSLSLQGTKIRPKELKKARFSKFVR